MSDDSGTADGGDDQDFIDDLFERAEAAIADGVYPPGIDADAQADFRRVLSFDPFPDPAGLRGRLERVQLAADIGVDQVEIASERPGATELNRVVRRLVLRQLEGVYTQVREYAQAANDLLGELVELNEALQEARSHLVFELDSATSALAAWQRGSSDESRAVAELNRRLELVEAKLAGQTFEPPYSNDEFETAFRGSRDELMSRYGDLADRFAGHGPVLDIGCGRGEFLELLETRGIVCAGIDADAALVDEARGRGLSVTCHEALGYLSALDDASLGGLVAIQVVEHLGNQQVADLVGLAERKLRPGGLVAFESVNPMSLNVFARAFYIDPTHVAPVHPLYMKFLVESAGFADAEIEWRSAMPDADRLEVVPETAPGAEVVNADIKRLNDLLFGAQDYAVLGRR